MDSSNGTWVHVLLHDKHLTDGAMNLKDFLFGYFVVVVLFLLWFVCFGDGNDNDSEDCFGQYGHFTNTSSSSHENPVLLSFRCSVLTRAWQES